MATRTGSTELPRLLSRGEVELCKQMFLREKLREKIEKTGYSSVTIEEVETIARSKAALTICGIKAIFSNRKVNNSLYGLSE